MSDPLNASIVAHGGAGMDSAAALPAPMGNQKASDADPEARMRQLEQNLAEMDRQMRARHAARSDTMVRSVSGSESKIGARRDGRFKAISSAPSFNWTPLGAAMVALPYTTISDLAGSLGVASSVRFNGQPAYTMGSYQPSGKGDEAGSGGGVRSGTVNGAVKPTSASSTVKAEGKRVVREGDTNTMNGGNNTGTYVIAVRPSNAAPKDARTGSNPPIRLETPEEKSAFGRWLDQVEERLRQARKHPVEAWKGAGKGVINIVPNLVEALAKGSAEQQAMELEQAASLQQVLGRPHAARAFSEGAAASRKAGDEVAVPKMAMSNPAQEGGDLVATGLQLFAGGVGLVRGAVKSIATTTGAGLGDISHVAAGGTALKSAATVGNSASDGVRVMKLVDAKLEESAMAGGRPGHIPDSYPTGAKSVGAAEPGGAGRIAGWSGVGGSGPAPGTIGITNQTAVGSLRNYSPKGGGVEFVYDPATDTFVTGRPAKGLFDGSPHEQLAQSIGVADRPIVGGTFHRGANGEIFTTENSGHYGKNWTNANRQQFQDWLNGRLDIPVKHQPWDK